MGSLPNARTVTLNPSDDVPSALLNEMQDCVVGSKRQQFVRTFWPVIQLDSTGLVTDSTLGVVARRATGVGNIVFDIPAEQGDRLTSVALEIFGDAASDSNFNVYYGVGMSQHGPAAGATLLGNLQVLNHPAAWTTNTVRNPTNTVGTKINSQIAAIGGTYSMVISIAAFSTQYAFGVVQATFDRL